MRHLIVIALLIPACCGLASAQSTVILVEPYQAAVEDKKQIEKKELPALEEKELELGNIITKQEKEVKELETASAQKVKLHGDLLKGWEDNPERKEFESECTTTPLDMVGAQYQKCKRQKEKLVVEKKRIEDWRKQVKKENEDIITKHSELTKKLDANRVELVVNRATQQKLHNYVSQLNVRIASLRQMITSQCTSVPPNASDEEIKLKCGNVQVDRAKLKNVPKCDTDRCRQYDAQFGN